MKNSISKIFLWFVLLSTFGVGGGILFLLFAVVPIEEWYVTRGWSQFHIDQVMKYYVFGWVIFGFIISFIYYYYFVKKEKWISSIILCIASVVLCGVALFYFLNTNSGVVQASQGEVETGGRFMFGSYPEKEDLERIKAEGYDGIIALLSDTLPIEKPLIDKLKSNGEEVGIEIYSMPMLPWVGDNAATLKKIEELVQKDDKRYYVHCYLGRHRVDVVKQLLSKYETKQIEVLVLQSTSLQRGNLYYDSANEVLFGPFPVDEEWFTRIKRGEVQEVVSIIDVNKAENYRELEKKYAAELNMKYIEKPIPSDYTLNQLQEIVNYLQASKEKVYVHNFLVDEKMLELETLYRYGKTIFPLKSVEKIVPNALNVSAKYVVGPPISETQKINLKQLGIEYFQPLSFQSNIEYYKYFNELLSNDAIYYFEVEQSKISEVYTLLYHLYYGFDKYKAYNQEKFPNSLITIFARDLTVGPIVAKDQIETILIQNGYHKVYIIDYPSLNEKIDVQQLKEQYEEYGIKVVIIPYERNIEEKLIPMLNGEQFNVYLMTSNNLLEEMKYIIQKY